MHRFPVLFLLLALLLPGCASRLPGPGQIRDLQVLAQQTGMFVPANLDGRELIPRERQMQLAEEFLRQRFSPWDAPFADEADTSDPFWGLHRYQTRPAYGENLLPLPPEWQKEMARQSAVDLYPSLVQPAVTVVTASLRVLPTQRPVFSDPAQPGEGFPFDYMQNSLVPAGTPVLVTHASLDGSWYLVKTAHFSGWLRPWEVAWADRDFMDSFRDGDMVAFVRDGAAVNTRRWMFAMHGRVGMVLPRSRNAAPANMASVVVPQRRADGWAELVEAFVPASEIANWPMSATADNFSYVLDGLLGQIYGWGGLFDNRDCSALIQDVYALFGVTMPRNSRAQAQAGRLISFEGLSAGQKEERILEQGVPLLTIINMPGHVMLYLGADPASRRPVVLHSMWGLRTKPAGRRIDSSGTSGRWVLGRTVITTLTPGSELAHLIRPQGLLVERVSGMTLLAQ